MLLVHGDLDADSLGERKEKSYTVYLHFLMYFHDETRLVIYEVPWQPDISPSNYQGPAILRNCGSIRYGSEREPISTFQRNTRTGTGISDIGCV